MFIVDLLRRGDEHGNINNPIISVLVENGIAEHVWISHDSTSNSIVEKNRNISIEHINVTASKKYKWITSTILTIKILFYAKKKHKSIFFLSTTPLQNLIITAFSYFVSKRVKNYVLLHGELSYLILPVGFGRRLGKFFLEASFKILPLVNVCQLTLAYPVYKAIKQRYELGKNLINLEIPIQVYSKSESLAFSVTGSVEKKIRKLRIGSFGVHSRDKSSHLIYELANHLTSYDDRIEIVTIGVANADFKYDQHSMVKHICKGSLSDSLIPRDLFLKEIRSLDFALFFYGNSPQYEMVSSGVFSDCINHGIPFAGISNNYLNHYIDKYGSIGFVRNSVGELAAELVKISMDNFKISYFKENLMVIRDERSFAKFEMRLLEIFKTM